MKRLLLHENLTLVPHRSPTLSDHLFVLTIVNELTSLLDEGDPTWTETAWVSALEGLARRHVGGPAPLAQPELSHHATTHERAFAQIFGIAPAQLLAQAQTAWRTQDLEPLQALAKAVQQHARLPSDGWASQPQAATDRPSGEAVDRLMAALAGAEAPQADLAAVRALLAEWGPARLRATVGPDGSIVHASALRHGPVATQLLIEASADGHQRNGQAFNAVDAALSRGNAAVAKVWGEQGVGASPTLGQALPDRRRRSIVRP